MFELQKCAPHTVWASPVFSPLGSVAPWPGESSEQAQLPLLTRFSERQKRAEESVANMIIAVSLLILLAAVHPGRPHAVAAPEGDDPFLRDALDRLEDIAHALGDDEDDGGRVRAKRSTADRGVT